MPALENIFVQEDIPDLDAQIIFEALKKPAAFQALYDRWAGKAYQYFYYRTGDIASAEDLTSQLFLSIYEALPGYRHRGRFAAWLFTIARNLVRKEFRKKQRLLPLGAARQVSSSINLSEEYDLTDEVEYLRKLILSLSDDEQELIRLRYAAGLSFADMAVILHKREDAVKKSLYRLRARLQALLEQNHA